MVEMPWGRAKVRALLDCKFIPPAQIVNAYLSISMDESILVGEPI